MDTNIHKVEKVDVQRKYFDKADTLQNKSFHVISIRVTSGKGIVEEIKLFSDSEIKITGEVVSK